MPRDGSGVYTKPFPSVVDGTTIESAVHNGEMNDIAFDLNAPRPIVAGGTGASDAATAMANLSGEVARQVVTNYSTHPFVNGSFYSTAGATGAPTAGAGYAGIYYDGGTSAYAFIEAREMGTGAKYTKRKSAGAWDAAWVSQPMDVDATYVNVTGDTMTGVLTATGFLVSGSGGVAAGSGGVTAGAGGVVTSGPLNSTAKINQLGVHGGTSATGALGSADANILLYNVSSSSWGGIGADSTGNIWLRAALSGSASAGFYLGVDGITYIKTTRIMSGSDLGPVFGVGLHVGYDGSTHSGASFRPVTDSTGSAQLFFNAAGTLVGSIAISAAGTTYNTTSNADLKEDLKAFDAGNIIDDTNVYDFAWKSTGERAYGVIAQQAVAVYPTAITHSTHKKEDGGEDDFWGVDYSKYVPVLLQELKALRARVRDLEGRIETKPQPA